MIPAREPIRVTVAIATFRRNEHLTELIPLLRAQGGELARGAGVAEIQAHGAHAGQS